MLKKKWLTLVPIAILPVAAISCGKDINTTGKIIQLEQFSKHAQEISNELLLDKTLAKLYGVDNLGAEFDKTTSDSEYYKNAYDAFKIYAALKLQDDSFYFRTKEQEWKIYDNPSLLINEVPSEASFQKYYKNKDTKIASEINKLLLSFKYLSDQNVENLKKGNAIVMLDNLIDEKQYNLINYVLKAKPAFKWHIESQENIDFFSQGSSTLTSWQDYLQISVDQKYYSKKQSKELAFGIVSDEKDKFSETKLYGYDGLVKGALDSYGGLSGIFDRRSFYKDRIVKEYGFYKPDSETLINAEELKTHPILAWKEDGSKMSVTYFHIVIPSFVEEEKRENDVKGYISFLEPKYTQEKLRKLTFLFAASDFTIYGDAQKYFEKLGFKLEATHNDMIEALKNKQNEQPGQ
ncbi:Uncharacterised protein [Mycoplasmopsis californica]|uniref:P60-like lipoprotein n=1 Tax=Mycoplasmopsis equigenitalium TaxID=114883 RepID=A0ABY5J1T8_9BACT|nr:hypothetical protein [Mycoplasmopsis equigenitalium]UUD36960.1 hypothetical protein NPA09_00035 [Mycoplasmopsis equigenitalium]VEU69745.1 Uncharacterised protein [Mycoplasmopsis californica]